MSLTRRAFIRNLSAAGGGLCLGFPLHTRAQGAGELRPNAFLRITPAGAIELQIHKAEMGQGVVTGFCTVVAEELGVAPGAIDFHFAPVDPAFKDPEFHMQITGGSTSLRMNYDMLRRTGASARDMLLRAASARSGKPPAALACAEGRVRDAGGSVDFSFAELAAEAAGYPVPEDPPLKAASGFTLVGRFDDRLDSASKVDGSAQYGIDAGPAGVPVAVLVRPPVAHGQMTGFSADAARGMPGVLAVVAVDGGVAVVAKNYWRARKAAEAVEIRWQANPSELVDSQRIDDALRAAFRDGDFREVREDGSAPPDTAGTLLEAEYAVPFLAHAAMEPLNCTVAPRAGGAEVWVGTQAPDLARSFAALGLGVDEEHIEVHNQFLGGGFGRRAFADNVFEAAQVARAIDGPVRLVWSREDDMRHDFYRPASRSQLRARLDGGRVLGWEHRIAGPSVMQSAAGSIAPGLLPGWIPDGLIRFGAGLLGDRDGSSVEGAKELPYAFDHVRVSYCNVETPVRLGFWRSVGHSFTAFVVESFVDELAHAAGEDPVAFRRRHLAADSPQRRVLDAVTTLAGWGAAPAGHFQGVAVHASFESVVAEVVEISLRDGQPKLEKVYCAIDCGTAVNPDIVRAQMESGIVFGLTAALKGEITFVDGAVQQGNFHDYEILRMHEVPPIEVAIIDSDAPPTGVGEPGTPPAAPALANAIFAATGQRLRSLPLRPA